MKVRSVRHRENVRRTRRTRRTRRQRKRRGGGPPTTHSPMDAHPSTPTDASKKTFLERMLSGLKGAASVLEQPQSWAKRLPPDVMGGRRKTRRGRQVRRSKAKRTRREKRVRKSRKVIKRKARKSRKVIKRKAHKLRRH